MTKKVLLLLFISALFIGCGNDKEEDYSFMYYMNHGGIIQSPDGKEEQFYANFNTNGEYFFHINTWHSKKDDQGLNRVEGKYTIEDNGKGNFYIVLCDKAAYNYGYGNTIGQPIYTENLRSIFPVEYSLKAERKHYDKGTVITTTLYNLDKETGYNIIVGGPEK